MIHLIEDSKATINLSGILDNSSIDIFDSYIDHNFEDFREITHLTIDFSHVLFIDSTGIGAILRAIYMCLEHGCTFGIIGLNDYLQEIFETMGVPRVIDALGRGAISD
ncbi:MAG: STAS domain-containing protein [Bacilli bacterium]